MTDRLDALVGRQSKDGKTFWTKVGVAFATKNGGWSVALDAMPASVDGQYKFVLFPPRQKNEEAKQTGGEFDSQIPF